MCRCRGVLSLGGLTWYLKTSEMINRHVLSIDHGYFHLEHKAPLLVNCSSSRHLSCRPPDMARKAVTGDQIVKLIVGAGQASPSPPVGPALGSKGVKSMDFCKACYRRNSILSIETNSYTGVQCSNCQLRCRHADSSQSGSPTRSIVPFRDSNSSYRVLVDASCWCE